MSNLDLLIPGMASLMEGDVEINNNVTVPDEAEYVAEAAEDVNDAVEGAETAAEIEQTAEAAEMISRQFDELVAMRVHVAKFGVDRSFLSLCNRDGILGRALGVTLPACESFDAVGSPSSAVSIACMEAFSDKVRGIWERVKEFVKNLCRKIRDLFARFGEWVASFFSKISERLEKLHKEFVENREFKKLEKDEKLELVVPAASFEDLAKGVAKSTAVAKVWSNATKTLFNKSFDAMNADKVKETIAALVKETQSIDEITVSNREMVEAKVDAAARRIVTKIVTIEQAKKYLDDVYAKKGAIANLEKLSDDLKKIIGDVNDEAEKAVKDFKPDEKKSDEENEKALKNLKDAATATAKAAAAVKKAIAAALQHGGVLVSAYAKVMFKTTVKKAA